ncbi:MAG TPA: STAS domain-containing protein [Terriglobales bacterium]|jgi:anti-anti-sigma factor
MNTQSAIMIKLPEVFGSKEARKLGQELKQKMLTESPSVLVDLSRVRQIDLAGLEGLLDCMEMVAKNDGALQLGNISPEAATILELTQMDRLFQKFPAFDIAANFTTQEVVPESEQPVTQKEGVAEKVPQPQPVAA